MRATSITVAGNWGSNCACWGIYPMRGLAFSGVNPKYLDLAAGRSEQPQHELQQGGFASAVGSDDGDKITLGNGEVHVFQNGIAIVGKP